jgi:outer membrane receptor for ferrienterochelin and colicins
MRRRLSAALVFAVPFLSSSVRAEETGSSDAADLDLVKVLNVEVSTATKTAESIEDAPAAITVVTREDIRRWGYQTVAEVLAHTVGFYLIDDHILPNAGVRGMNGGLGAESGVVKVMIDGRSVAYRTTSGNWLGVELVPLSSVEQIEIIRGPASALYGADAFLGVVNIITVSPERVRALRARAAVGMTEGHPGGRIDAASGGHIGKLDFLLGAAGEYTDSSGLELPPESPAPTLPPNLGGRRIAANLKRRSLVMQGRVGYHETGGGHLELSAYASGVERGGDFAHWAQLTNTANPDQGTVIGLGQFRLNLDGLAHLTRQLHVAVQSTYFQGGIRPDDRIDVASNAFYVKRHQSYNGVDTTLEARYVPSTRFNLIVGAQTIYDHERFGAPERIEPATGEQEPYRVGDQTHDLLNVGAYVSGNYKLIDPYLKLTSGVRYDHNSRYGSQVTGRVGLTSRISSTLVAKLLYGNAFKAPSPYLLYATPLRPGDVVGNPALRPQLIHTVEYQMSFTPSRFASVTSSVSYNWLLDKAEFTPQGINQTAMNIASQRSLTWETRADLRHYQDYDLYASLDLVKAERTLGQEGYAANLVGTANVAYPSWIVRAGAMVGVPSLPDLPLDVGAESILVGPRRAADTSVVERGEPFSLPTYLLLDVTLATRQLFIMKGHESRVALRAKNLLVARGPDPGFSGFEYPIRPAEIFLELEDVF